jgi:hypothetical protein
MNSTKKTARIAGLLCLVNGVTGFFSIIYVPSRLIVTGNAVQPPTTFSLPRGFSVGIVSELICAAEFVFLLWVLYRLFGAVNKTHASLMVSGREVAAVRGVQAAASVAAATDTCVDRDRLQP